ncbi:CENP-H-like protein Fta3 [Schizosaccharomyces osmophilus]|uniref:CENP-H-like protein Fta3 n=1 Tax=Schizosaccharomyces osmophilus TaxID=2545709 RepID=A0AAF0AV36_9SCHI|nr:CENP-H-like protein Fta3 [Schizosaccharomyces osmophilus]WBW71540.1 CENP-H-like protein Fta3 [Schizosaccharomyces osmophilus]
MHLPTELQIQCQRLVGLLAGRSATTEKLDSEASDSGERFVLLQREDRTYHYWKEFTELLRILSLTATKDQEDEDKSAFFDAFESLTTLRSLQEEFSSSSSSKHSKAYVESLLQKQNHFSEENLQLEEEILDLNQNIQKERVLLQSIEPASQEVAANLLQHSSKNDVYRDSMESTHQELRMEKSRWEILRNVVQVIILESGLSFADNEHLLSIMEECGEQNYDHTV